MAHVTRSGLAAIRRILTSQVSTVEAAGIISGIGGVGPSFDRSLLPRTTLHQAALTGLWAAVNYGIAATLQSTIESAVKVTGGRYVHNPTQHRLAILAGDATAIGIGIASQKLLTKKRGEPLARAGARAAGWRLLMAGVSGSAAITSDALADTVERRHTADTVNAPVIMAAGAAITSSLYLYRHRNMQDKGADTDQYGQDMSTSAQVQPLRALAVGGGLSITLYGLSRLERVLAHGIARATSATVPALTPYRNAIGHLTVLGLSGLAVERALAFAYRKTEQIGKAVEPAYRSVPDAPGVSGGPNSKIDWETLSREGRRFVNMVLHPDDISAVTQAPAIDPIRVFSGLDSAVSPNSRAFLAMEDLEHLGGLDRGTIAVFAPTGSGYVNYVAVETLEYLTGGDVASVAIQYSVRPSFLSLDQVGTAWESYLAFLTALAWRVRAMPKQQRPRVMLIGESLGSQASQDVFAKEGTAGFNMLGIDKALFLGSPYDSKWRRDWLADPQTTDPDGIVVEVQGIDEWRALDQETRDRARVVLLTHNNDPIPKFGAPLIIQEPDWLGDPQTRPAGVPRESYFLPGLTFLQTAFDLLNADSVVPGTFEAYAHDYRADVPQMLRVVGGFDVDDQAMTRIEKALRQRELDWAERRLVGELLQKSESQFRDKMQSWGVDSASVPGVFAAERPVESDPYAADGLPA